MTGFESAWLKLGRANKHIDDLEAVIAAFDSTNPYHIVVEDNPQTGKRVAKIGREPAPIPDAVPLILGDAVHAIRTSLDYFAYAADPAKIGKTKTAFPIWRNESVPTTKELKSLIGRQIGRASEPLKKALLALQPYKGGNGEQLWLIDHLDLIDKHRLLLTIGTAYGGIAFDAAGLFRGVADWVQDLPPIPISIRANSVYPVENGTELFIADPEEFEKHKDLKFAVGVAFGEPEILEGEPVVPTLRRLLDEVKGLLERLIPLV